MKLKDELKELEGLTNPIENLIIKDRINHLLVWYVIKATRYKQLFYVLSLIVIIINASIPVVNQLGSNMSIVVSLLSTIASVVASILTLLNAKDTWFRYRKHAELLKTECIMFNCRCNAYNEKDREQQFIIKVEEIIGDERRLWESTKFKNNKMKISDNSES